MEPLPWLVPIPVVPRPYRGLAEADAPFAIAMAGERIDAFGATASAPTEELAWCDLRDEPAAGSIATLGALSAGVYRGKYLEGIGASGLELGLARTEPLDRSVALRELAVARHLDAVLGDDRVRFVLCESVLLGDRAAISVRSGDFVRFSNLVWLAHRIDFFRKKSHASLSLTRFLRLFGAALDPALENPTPAALSGAFVRSFEAARAALGALAAAGVASVLDVDDIDARGRIVRLAAPRFAAANDSVDGAPVAKRYADLAWFFGTRFRGIATAGPPVSQVERDFAGALADAFAATGAELQAPAFSVREAPAAGAIEAELARWSTVGDRDELLATVAPFLARLPR